MKTWKVLPTDPRFQDLTEEQRALLYEDYVLSHPELFEAAEKKVYDEDFEEHWESLDKLESSTDDWEEVTEDVDTISSNFDQFIKEKNLEIDYRPEVKRLVNSDWEEVED